MTQPFRLPAGGQIDRSRVLRFTFDGQVYEGHPGDTLASALLANGVRVVGRSFKLHRPRGIFSAGPEEPSALVQVGKGALAEPNCRATEIALTDGLYAASQHAWPALATDFGALADRFAALLPAGFYYKTFQTGWARVWEKMLRRMAGLGRAPALPDPAAYTAAHAHCDVLVIGGGPAGLAAAGAAAKTGARVVFARRDARGGDAPDEELRDLKQTTVLGIYDGNYAVAVERLAEGAPVRQRLWHIRARRIVLAAGATERPIAFANNDRPGIMLAGAAATYVTRYAVTPGRRAVMFTNNDSAYRVAAALAAAGITVAAIVDLRAEPGPAAQQRDAASQFYPGHAVVATAGRHGLRRVWVQALNGDGSAALGPQTAIDCDLLAVSGGWTPNVQLFVQAQGTLAFDSATAAFLPQPGEAAIECVGAAAGTFSQAGAVAEGVAAGARAAALCGFGAPPAPLARADRASATPPRPLWLVPSPDGGTRAFVDLHNDVTAADIALAAREGFAAIEHVKRYTTLGMGTDQGRTGNLTGAALLAAAVGRTLAEIGTTTPRPPYVPVAFGALAGRARGRLAAPLRVTPMHEWHVAAGAMFEDVGQWQRPRYFPRPGEDMAAATRRECLAARDGVALLDASTLGKIEICGRDAGRFLDRLYINRWDNLAPGHCRYGVMCRDDGMVFDDGVGTRLNRDRFLVTTTTGHAAAVLDWFEEWRQTEWPELDVFCTSLTDDWANATLVGPRARNVLAALAPGVALDPAAFPLMTMREGDVAGIPARLFRVGFSGELAYEINVPADCGLELWERLIAAGREHSIAPYGTEAMHVLRAEKGYFMIGHETDGSVSPVDLGLGRMLTPDKDFLGKRALLRADLARPDRRQLVGLLPDDPNFVLPEGAALTGDDPAAPVVGHITSSYFGARIGRSFALALVKGGRGRHDERIRVPLLDGTSAGARIVPPLFYDPEGRRRDG